RAKLPGSAAPCDTPAGLAGRGGKQIAVIGYEVEGTYEVVDKTLLTKHQGAWIVDDGVVDDAARHLETVADVLLFGACQGSTDQTLHILHEILGVTVTQLSERLPMRRIGRIADDGRTPEIA